MGIFLAIFAGRIPHPIAATGLPSLRRTRCANLNTIMKHSAGHTGAKGTSSDKRHHENNHQRGGGYNQAEWATLHSSLLMSMSTFQ